ncbi:galactose oxidase early set domain-containing protein [Streptomyces sp. NPDC048419]|uniref:galactose oxidase early set domain-containing protein n=1 Tax=Streptomyces sp. NPDC048419 TaxID=3365547 RepID=UPI00371F5176
MSIAGKPPYADFLFDFVSPGHFGQRVEVYSPPYLFHGAQPRFGLGGATDVRHGDEITLRSPDATGITRVRLMRPGSATHVTDFDQRSVALNVVRHTSGSLTVRIPDDPSLVPPSWYMVIATDGSGTPSKALAACPTALIRKSRTPCP